MKATLIREWDPTDLGIHHKLYRCDPGGPFPKFVIVSASDHCAGQETKVFASNSKGTGCNYSDWLWEVEGALDHERALREAGYDVTTAEKENA